MEKYHFRDFGFNAIVPDTPELSKTDQDHLTALDQRFDAVLTAETAWRATPSPESQAFFERIKREAAQDHEAQAQWDAFARDRQFPRR